MTIVQFARVTIDLPIAASAETNGRTAGDVAHVLGGCGRFTFEALWSGTTL